MTARSGEFSADLAVVIGIDAYSDSVGRLETPVRDAEAIASLLESRFGYEVILLRDAEASKAGLQALLSEELPRRVGEGSRLLFYFAGHGVAQDSDELEGPEGFLVPHDAEPGVGTHLAMSCIRDALAGLPCRHLLVVLDCCFGGSFHWSGRRPLHVPGELLYEERYRHWVRHPARWALASAAHDEYALDIPDRRRGRAGRHSPFAAALLDGLQGAADRFPEGGDGVVTLAELYAYVRDRLTPHQSPVLAPLKGQTRGEYVFRDPGQPLSLKSAEAEVVLDERTNPYRGLEPYRAEHAELFFGRSDATRALLTHLREHRLTVVVGPSGSGKSSLVQAGLLPCLRDQPEDWMVPTPLRMAEDPFAVLGDILVTAGGPPTSPRDLRDTPKTEAWAEAWAASYPSKRLLIVVDQAEELVTRVARHGSERPGALPEASVQFLACLAAMLRAGDGRIHLLLTVRSDYETDLDEGPLAPLWKTGRFVVPPLSRGELRQIVEGPAAQKALYFEDPFLVDRLVDDVWGMPGGLPLLSYALSRLYLAYLRAGRGDRLLTAADLETILGESVGSDDVVAPGGIVRVLRAAADKAVNELPDDVQETLWRVLLRMVSLTSARKTRRQVPLRELDYPEEAENRKVAQVLDQLINKTRLVVSDHNDNRDVVEPAHDELLIAWPELVRRIDAARDLLPVHRRLTETAAEWAARPDPPRRGLDLRLLSLVEGSSLPVGWLNRVEIEYLAAVRQERKRRARVQGAAIAAILLLSVGVIFFRYSSVQQRERATLERSGSLARGAEAANRQQDFAAGGLLAIESLRLAKTDAALTSLALSKSWSWPLLSLLRGHTGPLSGISYSPDGRWLVSTAYYDDNVARLWDAKSFQPGPLLSHTERIYRATFHPSRQRVAVTDYADHVWIWDFDKTKARVECSLEHKDVQRSTFEAQGRFIITYSSTAAKVWNLDDCKDAKTLGEPFASVDNHDLVAFDPIPQPAAFFTVSNEAVLLWRIEAKGPVLHQRLEHPGGVAWVDVSSDGKRALTSGADGTARVWDLSGVSAKLMQELRHDRRINSGELSRDGRLAVTASADGTAKLWEESGGVFTLKSLLAHGAEVKSAVFDPTGRWIASWSYPRRDAGPGSLESDIVWIWTIDSGLRTAALLSDVIAVDFSPDGSTLAVAGFDKTAKIWKVGPARIEIPRDGMISSDAEKVAMGLDNHGELILVDQYKEQVRVWNLLEGKERFPPLDVTDQTLPALFLSKDGSRIVASDGREVTQWNTRTGAPINSAPDRETSFSSMSLRGGSLVITSSYRDWGREEGLQIWDPRSGENRKLDSRLEMIEQTLVSENGAYAALVGQERAKGRERGAQRTEIWDLRNATLVGGFQKRFRLEAVHPKGHSVVGREGPDNHFAVLVVGENHPRVISQDGWVMSARFSPDGSQLVTASREGTAWVWDTQLWKSRGTLFHGAWVTYATYDPRGELIATTANDGSTKIWSASTHEILAVLQHHEPQRICLFSPDSSVLVSQSADKSTVWRWRDEIADPEEDLLALRLSTARQLRGMASEKESWLRLPPGLPEPGSRVAIRAAARKLLVKAPMRSTVSSAADAILEDPDPALAWIDLYQALAGHPRSNGYRLLVLEELERREESATSTKSAILKLLLAATRAEGAEDPDGVKGTADRLREDIRQQAQSMLERGYRHQIVEALAVTSRM